MGHNSVVSNHPKSKGISLVDGLSMRLSNLGCHTFDLIVQNLVWLGKKKKEKHKIPFISFFVF